MLRQKYSTQSQLFQKQVQKSNTNDDVEDLSSFINNYKTEDYQTLKNDILNFDPIGQVERQQEIERRKRQQQEIQNQSIEQIKNRVLQKAQESQNQKSDDKKQNLTGQNQDIFPKSPILSPPKRDIRKILEDHEKKVSSVYSRLQQKQQQQQQQIQQQESMKLNLYQNPQEASILQVTIPEIQPQQPQENISQVQQQPQKQNPSYDDLLQENGMLHQQLDKLSQDFSLIESQVQTSLQQNDKDQQIDQLNQKIQSLQKQLDQEKQKNKLIEVEKQQLMKSVVDKDTEIQLFKSNINQNQQQEFEQMKTQISSLKNQFSQILQNFETIKNILGL